MPRNLKQFNKTKAHFNSKLRPNRYVFSGCLNEAREDDSERLFHDHDTAMGKARSLKVNHCMCLAIT